MLALTAVLLIGATHYGPGSRNSDGSPYGVPHVASRRFYGDRIKITWRYAGRVKSCRRSVRDKSGKDVIDFKDGDFDRFFGPRGRRLQPRGGWPVKVHVLGKIRGFGKGRKR